MDTETNTGKSCCAKSGCQSLMWWATLVVAVLAVPSFGIVVSLMLGSKGIGEVIVFIVACWGCTYLGMRLMRNPKMNERVDFEKRP